MDELSSGYADGAVLQKGQTSRQAMTEQKAKGGTKTAGQVQMQQ